MLHLGHVLNALYVWNTARLTGCRVMLRIEDHDRERSRPEFERAILDDLDWLGFVPDVHPTAAFRGGRCEGRQSDREEVYRRRSSGCASQLRVRMRVHTPGADGASWLGPGRRDRAIRAPAATSGLPLVDGSDGASASTTASRDSMTRCSGRSQQRPAEQCGDLLIRDRLGNWTYQFSAPSTIWWQGVDLVIRGIDLLESTGRQIQLARLLGRSVPATFMHHPLIMKTREQKLSKSDGDTGVRALAAAGWTRDRVFAEVARVPSSAGCAGNRSHNDGFTGTARVRALKLTTVAQEVD